MTETSWACMKPLRLRSSSRCVGIRATNAPEARQFSACGVLTVRRVTHAKHLVVQSHTHLWVYAPVRSQPVVSFIVCFARSPARPAVGGVSPTRADAWH